MEARVETSDTTTNATSNASDNSLNTSVASVDLDMEEDFSEEELKKAEEFKTKGNDAFKSIYFIIAH